MRNCPFTAVLQLEERELVRSEIGKITAGNFQMAAKRAGSHPDGGGLVFAVFSVVPRCGRASDRTRVGHRSRDDVALGAEICARAGTAAESPFENKTNKSWRVDETFVRVKGKWAYLYRAGATIDFLLSAHRDTNAAKRFFQKALRSPGHPTPRVINVDKCRCYPPAVRELKKEGQLRRRCRLRQVQYLNNILEQDHRAIKRRVKASQGFRSFWGAWRTIAGYEALNMIRKRQAKWVGKGRSSGNSASLRPCSASPDDR
jgi:transposase-like protein